MGKAKKCLVIGASSFIGVYVVDALLDAGYRVVGTGRNPRFGAYYASRGVEYVGLDLDDPTGLESILATSISSRTSRGGCRRIPRLTCSQRMTPTAMCRLTFWECWRSSDGAAATA